VVSGVLVVGQAFGVTGPVLAVLGRGAVLPWAALTVAVFAGRAAVAWLSDVLAARAAARVGTHLQGLVVGAVLRAPPGRRATGELAVLATRGVAACEPYLTRYLPALVLAAVLPPLTLAAIAFLDLASALVVLLTLPLVPVFGVLVGLATRDRATSQWRAMASLSGHFLDVVRGLPTLVAFRRADAQAGTIRAITHRYRERTLATLRIAFASSAVLELVATLSVALVAVLVGVRLAHGDLELRTALTVLLLAPEAYWPLRRVGAEFHAAAEGVATFEQGNALDTEADDGGHVEAGTTGASRPGAIVVDRLTVHHPGRSVPALSDVCAVLPGRGVTVVTGPSGCGKSTLLAALAGLTPPTRGSIRASGAGAAGRAWQSQVAWLPQRPVFVAGTLADNLRLARPDASDEALWEALRQVALEERVRDLPGGLSTPLGEDGATLSAGERARLALARVVVSDRPWVLLDEPTAHLDELTEQVIADTIVSLGQHRGVVVVAHRPALVELADVLLQLPAAVPPPARTAAAPSSRLPTLAPAPEGPPGSSPGLALPTLLGALASASGVALTATAGWLIVQASTRPAILTLMVAIVGVRAFGLARPVLRYAERLRSHDVVLRRLADKRVEVFTALVPLTPGRLGRRRGDALTAVVDDVDSVLDRELRVRMPVRGYVLVATLASTVAALLVPLAGLVVAGTCLLSGVAGYGLAKVGGTRAEQRSVDLRARLSERVVEVAQSATELIMWQADDGALQDVASISRESGRSRVRAARWLASGRAAVLVLTGAGVATAAVATAPQVAAGQVSGPMAALLVLLPLAVGEVAAGMADAGAVSARTRAAEERLDALTAADPAVDDPASPVPAPGSSAVVVDHLHAGWGDRPALRDLGFHLGPGDRVAVVGPSGSGKSTLAAVLMRFVDPWEGRVTLGDVPLGRLALDAVRRRVGLVDDDPHVFATTLVENVRLARPGASDAEVEAALRAARLGAWLDTLPDGLSTWLGDGHAAVSGGERARIAIARSLLADQPVLVLDEPTAHLDGATAELLAAEVLGRGDGRGVVWITHGTAGLDRVDRVLDLDRGPTV
ncbi:MAG TPA: thiol reductant ABC exporter subunit CydD, partial [Ornithinimicrobium sp.]|nr:thiol reductant ABC exporter subunit CydD [Ornithinimicrobium sp.]